MGRISGASRGYTAQQIWKRNILPAVADHRTGIRRLKGKTRNAIYEIKRFGSGHEIGQAQICVHESEKDGSLDVG